ncbi:MAG: hypothetical protein ABII88_11660 [Candidatus Omnitrophota bacterium]
MIRGSTQLHSVLLVLMIFLISLAAATYIYNLKTQGIMRTMNAVVIPEKAIPESAEQGQTFSYPKTNAHLYTKASRQKIRQALDEFYINDVFEQKESDNASPEILEEILNNFINERSKKSANGLELVSNELSIAALLRRYAAAQELYHAQYGVYAMTAKNLILEDDGYPGIIDPYIFVIDLADSKEHTRNGYYFMESINNGSRYKDKEDEYILCAIPVDYGVTGFHTLCISSRTGNVVMMKNNGARPIFYSKEINNTWEEF